MDRAKLLLGTLILFFDGFSSLSSSEPIRDGLVIRLFVTGPGVPIYTQWGHAGIAVLNESTGEDLFFDFGNFNAGESGFVRSFVSGRMIYSAKVARTADYVNSVRTQNRNLTEYVLNFTESQKKALLEKLWISVSPENRDFLYHNYKSNCSTKVRDLIDEVLDGRFQIETTYSRGKTFRQLTTEFLDNTAAFLFLPILLGSEANREISVWEEMFLPSVLGEEILKVSKINDSGLQTSLVSKSSVLNIREAESGSRPTHPLSLIGYTAFLLAAFYASGYDRTYLVLSSTVGLLMGLAGSVILYFMLFTDHDYTYGNINLLVFNPIAFLVSLLPIAYRKKSKKLMVSMIKRYWMMISFVIFSIVITQFIFHDLKVITELYFLILPATLVLSYGKFLKISTVEDIPNGI